jgi:hypothetical protein
VNNIVQTDGGDCMNSIKIVKYMTRAIESRKNCLNLAIDRGLGEGMQIEEWILVEMLSKLVELRNQGYLENIEREHKYRFKKITEDFEKPPKTSGDATKVYKEESVTRSKSKSSTGYEHCDLWWSLNNNQHWLEVKTIVLSKDQQRGSLKEIYKDLDKRNRLSKNDIFHHLSIIFPLDLKDENLWKNQLDSLYKENGLKYEADWHNETWNEQFLLMILYKQVLR